MIEPSWLFKSYVNKERCLSGKTRNEWWNVESIYRFYQCVLERMRNIIVRTCLWCKWLRINLCIYLYYCVSFYLWYEHSSTRTNISKKMVITVLKHSATVEADRIWTITHQDISLIMTTRGERGGLYQDSPVGETGHLIFHLRLAPEISGYP